MSRSPLLATRPLFAILLALALVAPAGLAEDASARSGSPAIKRILKRGKLLVGMSGNQPPLNMRSRSGELIGMEVDLARLLASSLEVELEIVEKPFAELLPTLQKGKVDAVISGLTITPERNLDVAFVGPYFISGKSVLTKAGTVSGIKKTEDIDRPGFRVGALAGSTSQDFVEEFTPNAELVPVANYDVGVQMVIGGEVDALVADFPICLLSVFRDQTGELVTLNQPLNVEPIGVALPPGDPLFQNLVQNYLLALQASGALELLQRRWFDDSSWLKDVP